MIITRTPLRICLGGGGTDIKEYYQRFGGYVVSAALNQYIYVIIHTSFDKSIRVCYSTREVVETAEQVRHPVVREAMRLFGIRDNGIEIISFADVPAGTGLGSSSTFTVGLITALAAYQNKRLTRYEVAEMACHIERDLLEEAGGKQDQYIAAFGGITGQTYYPDGKVSISPVRISHGDIEKLERNILLFFTGINRDSDQVQQELINGVEKKTATVESLQAIKKLGIDTERILRTGEIDRYAALLLQHWAAKQGLSGSISTRRIDDLYRRALEAGALAGKIIGAGGGGYLMLYCNDPEKQAQVRTVMAQQGAEEMAYAFDFTGSTVLVDDGFRYNR